MTRRRGLHGKGVGPTERPGHQRKLRPPSTPDGPGHDRSRLACDGGNSESEPGSTIPANGDCDVSSKLLREIEEEFLVVYANWLVRERRQPSVAVCGSRGQMQRFLGAIPPPRRCEFRFDLGDDDVVAALYDLQFRVAENHSPFCFTLWVNGVSVTAIPTFAYYPSR